MGFEGRLPFQPPRWLTPERVATAAAGVGAAIVMSQLMAHSWKPWLAKAGFTAFFMLCAVATVHFGTRRGSSCKDAILGVLWAAPLCGAGALVSLTLIVALLKAQPFEIVEMFFLSPVIAMGGFVIGLVLSPLGLPFALIAATGRWRPSHEAPVRAIVGAGVTLLAVVTCCYAIGGAGPVATVVPGAAMVAVGGAWMALRARFLRRVRAGHEPRFVIVESEGAALDSGLLPYRPLRGVCIVDTLAAVTPHTTGVYRGAERPIPVCLVQRSAR
jgi:hypothetical protein